MKIFDTVGDAVDEIESMKSILDNINFDGERGHYVIGCGCYENLKVIFGRYAKMLRSLNIDEEA